MQNDQGRSGDPDDSRAANFRLIYRHRRQDSRAQWRRGQLSFRTDRAGRAGCQCQGALAHELRNPLGPIRNAVDLLRNLDPYAPAAEENARQTIIRQTDHLVRLVDDLLDVARITQGKISLHEESVELQSFMLAAIEAAMPIIERRRHTLTTHLPEQSVWLRGDGIRLAQIVGNLLNNAAKFTPPGGEIGLTAQLQGGAVIIRVEDNGIGIATESIASIFDMFAQAQHAPDRVQDGL